MATNQPYVYSAPPIETQMNVRSSMPVYDNSPGYNMSSSSGPMSRVELHIAARNLMNRDLLSKSDPFCVVYMKDARSGVFHELGRTERIMNTLNPDWAKNMILEYHFEERQILKFAVYDSDSNSATLSAHDFLGSVECSLGEVVAASESKFQFQKPLTGVNSGSIVVTSEEVQDCKEVVEMEFHGEKLDRKDFLGRSDPFLVINKASETGKFVPVHKTEVIKNTLNPRWKPFQLSVASLCGGDHDRILHFDCYDWDSNSEADYIGGFQTTLRTLSKGPANETAFPCINPKKQHKTKYKHSGLIHLRNIRFEKVYSFLDFIRAGTQMNFSVAVDFTASNGNPIDPNSLHYRHPSGVDNHYASAIRAVGEIIQDYDTDKLFPALGFGGRLPPHGLVSHEFFLNRSPDNPYCQGVSGILEAYFHSLNTVQLYGPTHFAPVIKHVANIAASCQNGQQYFVLLIITDGLITDMDATKMSIIEASRLPMSIIIIGVGNEDFSAMDVLDSDGKNLSHRGLVAARDIVQFVEMNKFVSPNGQISKSALAREVLMEIPEQVVQFMRKRGIQPGNIPECQNFAQPMQQYVDQHTFASAPPPPSYTA